MTDFDVILFIKEEMLKASLSEKFVYSVVFLANDDDEIFNLMQDWMRNTDGDERKMLQEKMIRLLDKHNRTY